MHELKDVNQCFLGFNWKDWEVFGSIKDTYTEIRRKGTRL